MHRMLHDTHLQPYEYMNISRHNNKTVLFAQFSAPQHTSSRPEYKKADILKAPSRILMPTVTSDAAVCTAG